MRTAVPDPEAVAPAAAAGTVAVMMLIAQAAQFVIHALLSAALYKIFIPLPTFGRGVLVWGVTFLIWLGIAVAIALVVNAVAYLTAMN